VRDPLLPGFYGPLVWVILESSVLKLCGGTGKECAGQLGLGKKGKKGEGVEIR